MTHLNKFLLHRQAASLQEQMEAKEVTCRVAAKMMNHSDGADDKNRYQEMGDNATGELLMMQLEYDKIMRQLIGGNARPLTKRETIKAVGEMTNMELAENFKQN